MGTVKADLKLHVDSNSTDSVDRTESERERRRDAKSWDRDK